VLDRVREAFYEFGVPASSDFNKGNNYGCGYFDVNQMDGMRWSSADAFLTEEVLSRPNLTVLTGINVNKLVLSSSPNEPKVLGCTVSNNNNMVAGIGCRK
jgi:choline dehydrogenase